MEIFSKKILFTDLFFFLTQWLQRTCDGHFQCDASFLKSTFYSPVLSHYSVHAEDVRRPYLVWCNFSQKCFLQTCFFPNSVPIEDMRRPDIVWCSFSQKYFLQTCSFSYFSTYRGHATAILSVMQLLSKKILHTCCFSYFKFLQRLCERHT